MRLTSVLWGSGLILGVSAAFLACSGGTMSAADGGVMDAGPLPEGAILPDGGCPEVTPVLNVAAAGVQLAGEELVFLDTEAGPPFLTQRARAIRKVRTDGTGSMVLYTPMMGFQLNDLWVANSTIYFLESERLMSGAEQTRVFQMPVAGGAPTLIKLHDDPSNGFPGDRADAIVGLDASAIYLVRNILTPATLFRIALAGGGETIVTRVDVRTRPILFGSDFYFLTGAFPMNGYYGIGKVPSSASMMMPGQVGMASCKGDLGAGAWGFACTGAQQTTTERKLSKFDQAGSGHVELFGVDGSRSLRGVGPTDGTHVWTVTDQSASSSGANLYKVPLAGGPATVAACDRRRIRQRGAGDNASNGAFTGGLDMVLSSTHVYWIEERREDAGDVIGIYRALK